MSIRKNMILVTAVCAALSSVAANADISLFDKSGSKSLGNSLLGAKGSYSLTGTLGTNLANPNFKLAGDSSFKGSFLNDEKTIASYSADFGLTTGAATLDSALKLGTKTVWSYDGPIKLNKANPFGSYVRDIAFDGDQKWAYGALRADLSVKGTATYEGDASLTYKNKIVDATFKPEVTLAGKVEAKVSTAWTTAAVIAAFDPLAALFKLAAVVDDGVSISGETTDAAKFNLNTNAYLDLGAKKAGASVSGSATSPGANVVVEGFVKHRKLIFDPWPNMVTRTETFGRSTVLSATAKTKNYTLIDEDVSF